MTNLPAVDALLARIDTVLTEHATHHATALDLVADNLWCRVALQRGGITIPTRQENAA